MGRLQELAILHLHTSGRSTREDSTESNDSAVGRGTLVGIGIVPVYCARDRPFEVGKRAIHIGVGLQASSPGLALGYTRSCSPTFGVQRPPFAPRSFHCPLPARETSA
jgi:hypothetical protein